MSRRPRSAGLAVLPLVLLAGCSISGKDHYSAVANSDAANHDRAAFGTAAATLVNTIAAKLPTLHWSPPRTQQTCDADYVGVGVWKDPTRMNCSTYLSRVAGFDGTLADEITAFDAAARQQGWQAGDVTATIAEYQNKLGKPQPGTALDFTASDLDGLSYTGPNPSPGCQALDHWRMDEDWLEAGRPTDVDVTLVRDTAPPMLGSTVGEWFERASGPKPEDVVASQLAAHHYLVAVYVVVSCDYRL